MALADDLLEQAPHLARRETKKPKQASLRRAVSTAYYALFHLLIADAVRNWKRSGQRTTLARAFEHGRMKSASAAIAGKSFSEEDPAAAANLRKIASAFIQLQQHRHTADYDNSVTWSRTQALAQINRAAEAFRIWRDIRTESIAQDYLIRMLVDR